MSVEEKINCVLWVVFNKDGKSLHTCKVIDDHHFQICFDGNVILDVTDVKSISAHWKELIRAAVHKIIDDLLNIAIK
jgi:hypothetical protein